MATETVTVTIRFAFEAVRLSRIKADAHHEDAASRRVLGKGWMTFGGISQ
jgi:RimJ/RimL family protein N-acetyltransferase